MADEKCPYCSAVVARTDQVCPHCQRHLTTGTGRPGSPAAIAHASAEPQPVTVVDISMPFSSMVGFMVKWAIAAIPAIIILAVLFAIVTGILGGVMRR